MIKERSGLLTVSQSAIRLEFVAVEARAKTPVHLRDFFEQFTANIIGGLDGLVSVIDKSRSVSMQWVLSSLMYVWQLRALL